MDADGRGGYGASQATVAPVACGESCPGGEGHRVVGNWPGDAARGDPALVPERGGDGQFPLHFSLDPETAAFLLERGAEMQDARRSEE